MNINTILNKNFPEANGDFSRMLSFWRFKNKRIVFTNGCFDILHRGHAEYLCKASQMGDVLIIGLNSDNSVKRIKGKDRPVNNQENRSFLLASLSVVSAVVLFEEDTPENLINFVRPDVLVKGADYNEKTIVGANFVKSYGGKVETVDLVDGLSSSDILKKASGK